MAEAPGVERPSERASTGSVWPARGHEVSAGKRHVRGPRHGVSARAVQALPLHTLRPQTAAGRASECFQVDQTPAGDRAEPAHGPARALLETAVHRSDRERGTQLPVAERGLRRPGRRVLHTREGA